MHFFEYFLGVKVRFNSGKLMFNSRQIMVDVCNECTIHFDKEIKKITSYCCSESWISVIAVAAEFDSNL